MLSLLLFCLIIILTAVESKSQKDKISAQVGNDGSVRNIRSLLQTGGSGSAPNGVLHSIVYTLPNPGECVSIPDPNNSELRKVGPVLTINANNISIQECENNYCGESCNEDTANHLDTAIPLESILSADMAGCVYDAHSIWTDAPDGADAPECPFGSSTNVAISNPHPIMPKVPCNCPIRHFGTDTMWGEDYPVPEGTGTTMSFESDQAKDQIDVALALKNEAVEAGYHIVFVSYFNDADDQTYFYTKFPSTNATKDRNFTTYQVRDDDTDIFAVGQTGTAFGMHLASSGQPAITILLGTERLEQALDANNGGAHFEEFKNLMNRSGCYGSNAESHTVVIMYGENDNEVSGPGHDAFTPLPHIRFERQASALVLRAAGWAQSLAFGLRVSRRLSRAAASAYVVTSCNRVCYQTRMIRTFDGVFRSVMRRLNYLDLGTAADFCTPAGTANTGEIVAAIAAAGMPNTNTCGVDAQGNAADLMVIPSNPAERMAARLVRYGCRRMKQSSTAASARAAAIASARSLGFGYCRRRITIEFD